MSQKQLIVVDGDAGGGQILRNGFAIAALARQPLRIINIRAGRRPPGLQAPHLHSIHMLKSLCGGRLEGDKLGSMEVTFWPSDFIEGCVQVDTGTAGSLTLLTQIILPCLLFTPGPSGFQGKGGTDVGWSPPFDEMWAVFMPLLSRFGANAQLILRRRGFHPEGGGEVVLVVERPLKDTALRPIVLLDQGKVMKVDGRAFTAGERGAEDLHLMVETVQSLLSGALPGIVVQIQEVIETRESAVGNASGITLVAITSTGCRYGASVFCDEPGRTPTEYGKRVVEILAAQVRTGSCVDEWTQDQLVLYMALAGGDSEVRIGPVTNHTRSAIMAAETLLPCRFTIEPDGETNILCCEGIGLIAPGEFTTAPIERPRDTTLTAPLMVPFLPPGAEAPAQQRSPSPPPRSPSPPAVTTPAPPAVPPSQPSNGFVNPFRDETRPAQSSKPLEPRSAANDNPFRSPPRSQPQAPSSQPPPHFQQSMQNGQQLQPPFGASSLQPPTLHQQPHISSNQNPFADPVPWNPAPPSRPPPPMPSAPADHPFGAAVPSHIRHLNVASPAASDPFAAPVRTAARTSYNRSPSPRDFGLQSRKRSPSPPFGHPQASRPSAPASNPFGPRIAEAQSQFAFGGQSTPAAGSSFGAQSGSTNPFGQKASATPFGGVGAFGESTRPSPPEARGDSHFSSMARSERVTDRLDNFGGQDYRRQRVNEDDRGGILGSFPGGSSRGRGSVLDSLDRSMDFDRTRDFQRDRDEDLRSSFHLKRDRDDGSDDRPWQRANRNRGELRREVYDVDRSPERSPDRSFSRRRLELRHRPLDDDDQDEGYRQREALRREMRRSRFHRGDDDDDRVSSFMSERPSSSPFSFGGSSFGSRTGGRSAF